MRLSAECIAPRASKVHHAMFSPMVSPALLNCFTASLCLPRAAATADQRDGLTDGGRAALRRKRAQEPQLRRHRAS
eukprot:6214741-Pleurochrysis_carterae.AAC.8